MKVWTIQRYAAWEHFTSTGVLRADAAWIDPHFLTAYRWLVLEMISRLGPPPAGIDFPIWVWSQWESARQPRPALRRAGHLPRGETGILLECDCPASSILLSDFVLWHHVLNNWYLPADEADQQAFEARCAAPTRQSEPCQQQKAQSWQRIFDLDWYDPHENYPSQRDHKAIQGTLWEIGLGQVKSTKVFVAR